jgi:hypothetical protein
MLKLMYVSDIRPIYAGNALCTVKYTGEGPCMMSIRSTSFSPATEAMSETKVAPITQVDLSFLSEGLFGSFTVFFCLESAMLQNYYYLFCRSNSVLTSIQVSY